MAFTLQAAAKAGLEVKLPGGLPGRRSDGFPLASLDPMEVLVTAGAGLGGRAELPISMAGAIWPYRHPRPPSTGRWEPQEAPNEASIELPPAAERPLAIRQSAPRRGAALAEVVLS